MKVRVRMGWGSAAALVAFGWIGSSTADAFPGGTPETQRSAGVYCASCHASLSASDFDGVPAKGASELAEAKHLTAVRKGVGTYDSLPADEREAIAKLIEAVDAASTVTIQAPAKVSPGQTFELTVELRGGAGPVVAVSLVDRPHRLYARSAWMKGWQLVSAPKVVDGRGRRLESTAKGPDAKGRGENMLDIRGISSDARKGRWASARVVYTLRAPSVAGDHPLVAAYLYGTEKAIPETTRADDPRFPPFPLGGQTAASGRVKFSPVVTIHVEGAPAAAPAAVKDSGKSAAVR